MDDWVLAAGAGYLLWWLLTRFRIYRWVLVFVILAVTFAPPSEDLPGAAPFLVGLGTISFLVFHGRQIVRGLLGWA